MQYGEQSTLCTSHTYKHTRHVRTNSGIDHIGTITRQAHHIHGIRCLIRIIIIAAAASSSNILLTNGLTTNDPNVLCDVVEEKEFPLGQVLTQDFSQAVFDGITEYQFVIERNGRVEYESRVVVVTIIIGGGVVVATAVVGGGGVPSSSTTQRDG